MPLKMSQLVQATDTPKSTILYYIKEGLLPEPQKPKPNVHLYDESTVDRIRFIKYLQKNFGASIEQIRELMQREEFDFSRSFEAIMETLELVMAPPSRERYDRATLCAKASIDCEKLNRYLERGAIYERDGGFSDKELEILRILKELETIDPDGELLDAYLLHAQAVARAETRLVRALEERQACDNPTVKALFDATLILKPYLFNMRLFETYRSGEPRKDRS
jgi:DNA-binding transcriptional MerR regulator